MRFEKRFCILCAAAAVLWTGCSDNASVTTNTNRDDCEKTDSCDDPGDLPFDPSTLGDPCGDENGIARFVSTEAVCSVEDILVSYGCSEYTDAVLNGRCPRFYECLYSQTDRVYECSLDGCSNLNEFKHEGQCIAESVEQCGAIDKSCAELDGWKAGECSMHQCIASECKTGFRLEDGTCKPNLAEDCHADEHFNYVLNICEPDETENCGSSGINCTKQLGWVSGSCQKGSCIADTCSINFELQDGFCNPCSVDTHVYQQDPDSNQYICEANSLTACGSHDNDCTAQTGWKDGQCSNSQCVPSACQDHYTIVGNTCVAETCDAGYHPNLSTNTCVQDDTHNCGATGLDCATNTYGWDDGVCTNGLCEVIACKTGCELQNGICTPWYESSSECAVVCDASGYADIVFEGKSIRAKCIETAEDLIALRDGINSLASYTEPWPAENTDHAYILMNDIDLGEQPAWDSIGNAALENSPMFYGTFLGNNKTISGTITCTTKYCGLFGELYRGRIDRVISNVNLNYDIDYIVQHPVDEYVKAAGSLVSFSMYSTVSNNVVNGNVTQIVMDPNNEVLHEEGDWFDLGGIIGYAESSIIQNNTFTGSIKAKIHRNNYVGGILGGHQRKALNTIDNCHFKGKIAVDRETRFTNFSSSMATGGICGYCRGTLNNSTSSGEINAFTQIGGIAGDFFGDSSMKNNVFTGSIKALDGYAGGIVGISAFSSYLGKTYSITLDSNVYMGSIDFANEGGLYPKYAAGIMAGIIGSVPTGERIMFVNNVTAGSIQNADKASSIFANFGATFANNAQNGSIIAFRNNWSSIRFNQTKASDALAIFDCPSGTTCPTDLIVTYGNYVLDTQLSGASENATSANTLNFSEPDASNLIDMVWTGSTGKLYPLINRMNLQSIYSVKWHNMLCTQSIDTLDTVLDGNHRLPLPIEVSPDICK